jgi:hypothetical protein
VAPEAPEKCNGISSNPFVTFLYVANIPEDKLELL